tara:strand:- start:584 stop:1087 length:504 start_codon:yes stop_codon:yes gene_type:complete
MLNAEDKPDRKHSSSSNELERGFGARLKEAIGQRSVLSFAKECGISDSLVRKYLAGSLPGLDKALVMARTLGVSLEWLATGEGEMVKVDGVQEPSAHYHGEAAPAIDMEKLEEVITKTQRMLQERGVRLKPEAEAKVIRLIYEYYIRHAEAIDDATLDNVIQLAAFR